MVIRYSGGIEAWWEGELAIESEGEKVKRKGFGGG